MGASEAQKIVHDAGLVDDGVGQPLAIKVINRPEDLVYPEGITEYAPGIDGRFLSYLIMKRGFDEDGIARIFKEKKMLVGRFGKYAARLIIPYTVNGKPVYFTARAITDDPELRYRACPNVIAPMDPSHLLFNQDLVTNPAGIILTEGPLDAIKATEYGDLPALAMSTNHATKQQMALLHRARRVFIFMDNDELDTHEAGVVGGQALDLYYELIKLGIPCKCLPVPAPYKDLAEIPAEQFKRHLSLEKISCM